MEKNSLHSKTVSAARKRQFKTLVIGIGSVLAVFLSVAKGPELVKRVGSSMRLEEVEWEEDGSANLSKLVTRDVLWKASELSKGAEMIPIDLEVLEKKIRNVPWVESVYIQKKLPSTLYVRYSVHNARAIALRKGHLWSLSSAGQWIAPLGRLHLDLPVIIGSDASANQTGLAIRWLDRLEADFKHFVQQIDEINVSPDKTTKVSVLFDLKYSSRLSKVRLRAGDEPTPENLSRLKRVIQYLIKNNILVSAVDLRSGKKVVVNVGRRP